MPGRQRSHTAEEKLTEPFALVPHSDVGETMSAPDGLVVCFYTSEDNRSLVSTGHGHCQRCSVPATQEGLSDVGLQLCSSKVIKKLHPPTVLIGTDKSG